MGSDTVAIAAGLVFSYWLRFHSDLTHLIPVTKGYEPQDYLHMFPLACVVWFLALRLENLYRRRSRVLDFQAIRRIVTGSLIALLVLIAINFYRQSADYSRLVSVIVPMGVIASLILNRVALHFFFKWLSVRRGIGQSRTAVIGTGSLANHVIETLHRHPEYGMRPMGVIDGNGGLQAEAFASTTPVLGSIGDLAHLLEAHRIDEVILAQPEIDHKKLPEILITCERAVVDFRIVPDTSEMLLSGMTVETLDGIPLIGVRETPLQGWNAALKRLFDFSLALAGLVVAAPVIGVLAWLVRRQDGLSPFYTQERMGIDGQRFTIVKLRSMGSDAEKQSGPIFADDHDPRCTALGGFLRRSHLDELPQLVNILRGEMSLVGPRPERPYFVDRFREDVPHYMARHKVRSGITGWAQVNGLCGKHGSIVERLRYDLYYIENWSLWLDIRIIVMTLIGRQQPGPSRAK